MHIGLIGCGVWGRNILRDLCSLGVRVSVVDNDDRARKTAVDLGAEEAVCKPPTSVDGWVVATPASTHAQVIRSLATDVPILCEKPLCTNLDDIDTIRDSLNGPLHLMDVWRYHPAVELMGELATKAKYGKSLGLRLTRANWTSPRTDVDTAWNLAPHELSIFYQVFAAYPKPVHAHAELLKGDIRSLWSHWKSKGGQWLVSEVSNRFEKRRREIRLHAEEIVWVYNGVDSHVTGFGGDSNQNLEASTLETHRLPKESALIRQLSAWLGFLNGGEAPRSDLGFGGEAVKTIIELRNIAKQEMNPGVGD